VILSIVSYVPMWFMYNCSKELQNDEVSDTTDDDNSNAAGFI